MLDGLADVVRACVRAHLLEYALLLRTLRLDDGDALGPLGLEAGFLDLVGLGQVRPLLPLPRQLLLSPPLQLLFLLDRDLTVARMRREVVARAHAPAADGAREVGLLARVVAQPGAATTRRERADG